MKRLYYICCCMMLLLSVGLEAQQLNYQGIARNANGVALSFQQISLRLTIRDGSATGTNVYSETRSLRTNQFGLFTTVIGSIGATNVTGSFATINWITGNKFLQVEIDPDGGSNFIVAGVSQLQSVPFAFFASAAYPVGAAGGDLNGSTYPNPIITNAAITTTKIADTAITTIKIRNAAVTNQKLLNSTVQLNGLTLPLGGGQYFAIGTAGSNFTIRSEDSVHTFNIPTASAIARGLLSPASFTTFTNKQDALNGIGFIRATGTTISYDNTNYTPTTRTINGLDLSANRILNTDNISEGTTNLYYTATRARQSISLSGENYLSYNNTTGALTASAVNLSGSNVTGTLAAARIGALTGDITSTAGSYTTTIANNAVTTTKIADNTITNAKLQNSSFTLGTTAINLGTSQASISGLTSVAATSFIGALTGNASTATIATNATTLQNARNFSITGDITATAQSFDGSANVALSTTIANNAITTTKIADNTITEEKIVTGAVTFSKFQQIPNSTFLVNPNIGVGNGAIQAISIPTALEPFAVKNQTTQQASTNFNIAGSGTIGTTLTTKAAVFGYAAVTNTYTVLATDHYLKVTTASITVTLPSPSGNVGRRLVIANRSGGTITIATPSGTFEGYSFTGTLNNNSTLCVFSDGTNWQLESNAN